MSSKRTKATSFSSKQRKPTSKRLRFEVFKRDNFTCQYCGAQPPDVVLECDHIEPVSAGGMTTADNLLTACENCNRGKSNISLGDAIVRPDADLMWLQAQQEIVEMRRYKAAIEERNTLLRESIRLLQDQWSLTTGSDVVPNDHILASLLNRYSLDIASEAVEVTAKKVSLGMLRGSGDWTKYIWGVARNIAAFQEMDTTERDVDLGEIETVFTDEEEDGCDE